MTIESFPLSKFLAWRVIESAWLEIASHSYTSNKHGINNTCKRERKQRVTTVEDRIYLEPVPPPKGFCIIDSPMKRET